MSNSPERHCHSLNDNNRQLPDHISPNRLPCIQVSHYITVYERNVIPSKRFKVKRSTTYIERSFLLPISNKSPFKFLLTGRASAPSHLNVQKRPPHFLRAVLS